MDNQKKIDFNLHHIPKSVAIDYKDSELFGSDDAAYVEFGLLKSYSIPRTDCQEYFDEKAQFRILCAPKGTGKTTICRIWENEISVRPGFTTVFEYDSNISPDLPAASPTTWIREWKKAILQSLISRILSKYDVTDWDVNKVDILKEIGSDRTNKKTTIYNLIEKILQASGQEPSLIKSEHGKLYWIFLDEIDQYFKKDEYSISKVSGMLVACRELASLVPNLYIRTTLKPTVWSVLRTNVSGMATLTELIVHLSWTNEGIRAIIAKRIESYLIRTNAIKAVGELFSDVDLIEREDGLIHKVFSTQDFDLGKGNRKPHVILSSLGFLRPRWVLDLCQSVTKQRGRTGYLIEFSDVKACLGEYGNERIKDIATEYNYQCSKISEIIFSFLNTKSSFTLNDLFAHINKNILSKTEVSIAGISEKCDAQQIVNFLYEMGFVEPKKIFGSGKYEFFHFKDYPSLIENEMINEKVQEDLFWEIHPAFRNILHLGQLTNREVLEKSKRGYPKN